MSKIKIFLAVPNLDALGVQHDVRTLYLQWDHDKFEVELLVNNKKGGFAEQFPDTVKYYEADNIIPRIPKFRAFLRLLGYMRHINVQKPDIIISFVPLTNYYCYLSKLIGKHQFKLIVSEHAHVSAALMDKQNAGNWFMLLYRYTFRMVYNSKLVDKVKCIAEDSMNDLRDNHGIIADKMVLINNPIPIKEIRTKANYPIADRRVSKMISHKIPYFVCVARLKHQKRHDILIEAFALVRRRHLCNLVLIGDGDFERVNRYVKGHSLEDCVYIAGYQQNPWNIMRSAVALVLTSDWEGLPCVISESMAIGLPVISSNCPSGPSEMLLDGAAGWLFPVGDYTMCAKLMEELLFNYSARQTKIDVGQKSISRFDPAIITLKYQNLALEVL